MAYVRILARASVHRGKDDSVQESDERYEEPELKWLRDPEQDYSQRAKHSRDQNEDLSSSETIGQIASNGSAEYACEHDR